jgi:hypothetical protein
MIHDAVYDPRTGKSGLFKVEQPTPSGASCVVLQNGDVLIAGGYYHDGANSNACMIYRVLQNRMHGIRRMVHARAYHAGCLLEDGRVFIYGGKFSSGLFPAPEIYDPETNEWDTVRIYNLRDIPPNTLMSTIERLKRSYHMCVQLPNGKIFISGDNDHSECLLFDLNENTIAVGPEFPIPLARRPAPTTVPVYE